MFGFRSQKPEARRKKKYELILNQVQEQHHVRNKYLFIPTTGFLLLNSVVIYNKLAGGKNIVYISNLIYIVKINVR